MQGGDLVIKAFTALVKTSNAPGYDALDCLVPDAAILGQIGCDLQQVKRTTGITISRLGNKLEVAILDNEFARSQPTRAIPDCCAQNRQDFITAEGLENIDTCP